MIDERKATDILENMLSRISDKYDTSQNSFIHQSLASAAIELEEANKELITISNKFDYWKLEGEELDFAVFDRTGIIRREALKASGEVTFTGIDGTVIPVDTVVLANQLEFKTLSEVDIIGTTATVEVVALSAGEIGNVRAGSIKKLQKSIYGISDVTNSAPLVGGRDEETKKRTNL